MLRLVFSSRKDKPYRPVFEENCFAEQSFVRGTLPERKSYWALKGKDKPYRPVFEENCFAEQSFVRGTLRERKSSRAKQGKDKPYRPVFEENCFAKQSFERGTLPERKSSWEATKTSRTDQLSKKTALRSKVSRGVKEKKELRLLLF